MLMYNISLPKKVRMVTLKVSTRARDLIITYLVIIVVLKVVPDSPCVFYFWFSSEPTEPSPSGVLLPRDCWIFN